LSCAKPFNVPSPGTPPPPTTAEPPPTGTTTTTTSQPNATPGGGGGDDNLTCFRCDYRVDSRSTGSARSFLLYLHYVEHYETELAAHLDDKQACRLCHKAGKTRTQMLRHLALQHHLLEPLLPESRRLPPASGQPSRLLAVRPPRSRPQETSAVDDDGGDIGFRLTCPLCSLVLHRHLPVGRHRAYLYQHFVVHFKAELAAYTDGGAGCQLCGSELRPERRLLRHVGLTHGLLDQLLPPDILAALEQQSPPGAAAAQELTSGGGGGKHGGGGGWESGVANGGGQQLKEEVVEEGREFKMVFADHLLVGFVKYIVLKSLPLLLRMRTYR
jgi:hypothetical protein